MMYAMSSAAESNLFTGQKKKKCIYEQNYVVAITLETGVVRASASRSGGRGFEPRPGHTKDFNHIHKKNWTNSPIFGQEINRNPSSCTDHVPC